MSLDTNFKDDILNTTVNQKRKYQMIHNADGTVSFEDMTAYLQAGSEFGSKEVNEERLAINKINSDRIVSLNDIDLVTEPGFFVDAMAVRELNSKLLETEEIKNGLDILENVHQSVLNGSSKKVEFYRRGKTLDVYVNICLASSVAQYTTLFKLPERLLPAISYLGNTNPLVYINADLSTASVQQPAQAGSWIQFSASWQLK